MRAPSPTPTPRRRVVHDVGRRRLFESLAAFGTLGLGAGLYAAGTEIGGGGGLALGFLGSGVVTRASSRSLV